MMRFSMMSLLIALAAAPQAGAQSSSLYVTGGSEADTVAASRYGAPTPPRRRDQPDINPVVPRLTIYHSRSPEPRAFAVNDHVTIIVQESFEAEMDAEKTTEKSTELGGGVTQFPRLTLKDLLDLQLTQGNSEITVDVGFDRKHEGEGEYGRTESMIGRVTARIIDIKDNGTLVLEARRTMINDGEESTLVATGNCRPEDITPENTIVSWKLENLFVDKQHAGDLRESGEKGWITRVLDAIFDF